MTGRCGRARTSSDLGRSCCSSERGRGRRLPDAASPTLKISGAELRVRRGWAAAPALAVVAVGPTSTSSLSRSFCSYDVVSMPSESASSSRPPALPQRLAEVGGVRAAGVEVLTRAAATGDADRTAMPARAAVLEEDGTAVLARTAPAAETAAGLCSGPLLTMLSSWKIRCCCICTVVSSREMRSRAARITSSMALRVVAKHALVELLRGEVANLSFWTSEITSYCTYQRTRHTLLCGGKNAGIILVYISPPFSWNAPPRAKDTITTQPGRHTTAPRLYDRSNAPMRLKASRDVARPS